MKDVQPKHVPQKAAPITPSSLNEDYLTATQFAKIIQVTPQTVNNWHRVGIIPASLHVNETIRYDRAKVLHALDRHTSAKNLAHEDISVEGCGDGIQPGPGAGAEHTGDETGQRRVDNEETLITTLRGYPPEFLEAVLMELHRSQLSHATYWKTGTLG